MKCKIFRLFVFLSIINFLKIVYVMMLLVNIVFQNVIKVTTKNPIHKVPSTNNDHLDTASSNIPIPFTAFLITAAKPTGESMEIFICCIMSCLLLSQSTLAIDCPMRKKLGKPLRLGGRCLALRGCHLFHLVLPPTKICITNNMKFHG